MLVSRAFTRVAAEDIDRATRNRCKGRGTNPVRHIHVDTATGSGAIVCQRDCREIHRRAELELDKVEFGTVIDLVSRGIASV
jgi:hypothetical protein